MWISVLFSLRSGSGGSRWRTRRLRSVFWFPVEKTTRVWTTWSPTHITSSRCGRITAPDTDLPASAKEYPPRKHVSPKRAHRRRVFGNIFTVLCNIGPQNVSVKFQPQIPNRSFIITAVNIIFGVCPKTSRFGVYANELHIQAPSPEEGIAYTSLSALHIYVHRQIQLKH